ncbi:MAG: hypothetical protein RL456_1195 [Pseudomonadota bacterium]
MDPVRRRIAKILAGGALAGAGGGLAGCATGRGAAAGDDGAWLARVTWGPTPASAADCARRGRAAVLAEQLGAPPDPGPLPAAVQARLDAMSIAAQPMVERVLEMERLRREGDRDDHQRRLIAMGREAGARSVLLAIHSPWQLREQMTAFWFNHFNVVQFKANLRTMVSDYEQALRAHALGRFPDLLVAATTHAAMLRYLDNEQNMAGRVNENHARELMELHTLGVEGGYTQRDVQELARVLTGLGVRLDTQPPARIRPEHRAGYRLDALVEFHPGRHDAGDKVLLGEVVRGGQGWAEILEQLGRLARHPSTARHVARRLAMHFVADVPPPALVARLARRHEETGGDLAQVMAALFAAPEFEASLGGKFKDPLHWVVSAARLAAGPDGVSPWTDATALAGMLDRLGRTVHGRATPDGYPLDEASWAGSGQLAARFEAARTLARAAPLPAGAQALARPGPGTRAVLDQARDPQERDALLLASPEFMRR